MALVWKAMKDGHGRTVGYVTKLPDDTSVYIRNTGGRRSTGTWMIYVNSGSAQVTLDRWCSLGSAKAAVQDRLADVTAIFQKTGGEWVACQPTASGFKHTTLGSDRQIHHRGQAIKKAYEMLRTLAVSA